MLDTYQQIEQSITSELGGILQKVLLYSEVEDGVISADLFFQLNSNSDVCFRFAPKSLQSLIYSLWGEGNEDFEPHSWRVLQFVIEGGNFVAELTFPDQLDPSEELHDRRPRAIAKHFPGFKVDYSKPKG